MRFVRHRILRFGLVYLFLGVASAVISNPVRIAWLQAALRLGVFGIAVIALVSHIRMEVSESAGQVLRAVLRSAFAVAFGTLLLALFANLSAWLETGRTSASLRYAIAVWPIATGVAACLGAVPVAFAFRRRRKGGHGSHSQSV